SDSMYQGSSICVMRVLQSKFLENRLDIAAETRRGGRADGLVAVETYGLADNRRTPENRMRQLADQTTRRGMLVVGGLRDIPDRRGGQTLRGERGDSFFRRQRAGPF